jgi:inosine-uridine nucleoside N-ribohydrolase
MLSRALVMTLLPLALGAADRVLVDTDSGFFGDDAAAVIMLARSPARVTLAGLTLVAGNVWPKQGAEYMFHVLGLLQRTGVPVYLGAPAPLAHTREMVAREASLEYTGAFAMAPHEVQPPFGGKFTGLRPRESGIDFIVREVERHPGQVAILALGPMTNIALALERKPEIAAKIKRLVFMGGNVRVPGNASKEAEFNFWFDAEAAGKVLRSAIPEKVMFGLDICNRAPLTRREFDRIVAVKTPITAVYAEDRGHRYPGYYKDPKAVVYLWDELPAAWLLDPTVVTKKETLYLDVETGPAHYGRVIQRRHPGATPVTVMLDLNLPQALDLYTDLLTRR